MCPDPLLSRILHRPEMLMPCDNSRWTSIPKLLVSRILHRPEMLMLCDNSRWASVPKLLVDFETV